MKRTIPLTTIIALAAITSLPPHASAYYHAQLGRFLNRDPIGYDGGDKNLYRSMSNRPTTVVDPLGLATIIARPNQGLGDVIFDFLTGGESNHWYFRSNHRLAARVAAHKGLTSVREEYRDLIEDWCCENPDGQKLFTFGPRWFVANYEDFKEDVKSGGGIWGEGWGNWDVGINMLGSFGYRGVYWIDCAARLKRVSLTVWNTFSTQSLTRNPVTREPLLEGNLLNPVTVHIEIWREDKF